MDFYRGDDRSPWKGEPTNICNVGFTLYPANKARTLEEARDEISRNTKNLLSYMTALRVQTPGGLISTAMIPEGAFEAKECVYKIAIPDIDLELRLISNQGTGAAIPMNGFDIRKCTKNLLIRNAPHNATNILALVHGMVSTKEATFYTAIPQNYIVGYRGKHEDTYQPITPPLPPR
jgi:hypothetical protein